MAVTVNDLGTAILYKNSATSDLLMQFNTTVNGTSVLGQVRAGGYYEACTEGVLADPAYTFVGDTDTGIFRQAADKLSVAAGGVEIIRCDTVAGSGVANVMISVQRDGTTSLQRVSLGSLDSGGSGYRLLRVPSA